MSPHHRYRPNPHSRFHFSSEQNARLDALTDAEIEANAAADSDNPPLDEERLARMQSARLVRDVRARTGLSQPRFAEVYHFTPGRLRDLEQGRTRPDSAVLAYLKLIQLDPERVRRELEQASFDD